MKATAAHTICPPALGLPCLGSVPSCRWPPCVHDFMDPEYERTSRADRLPYAAPTVLPPHTTQELSASTARGPTLCGFTMGFPEEQASVRNGFVCGHTEQL